MNYCGAADVDHLQTGLVGAGNDTGFATGLEQSAGFTIRIGQQENAGFSAGDGGDFADQAIGIENGKIGTQTVGGATVDLEAFVPVGSISADDARAECPVGEALLEGEGFVQAKIFGDGGVEGAELLAEKIVGGTKF